jgi:hypothetical protein
MMSRSWRDRTKDVTIGPAGEGGMKQDSGDYPIPVFRPVSTDSREPGASERGAAPRGEPMRALAAASRCSCRCVGRARGASAQTALSAPARYERSARTRCLPRIGATIDLGPATSVHLARRSPRFTTDAAGHLVVAERATSARARMTGWLSATAAVAGRAGYARPWRRGRRTASRRRFRTNW